MPVDLLIKSGHVIDPGQGIDDTLDIAITNGKIAAIGHSLPEEGAAQIVEMRGSNRYVVPGLIDLHTHVAIGATTPGVGMECSDADVIGVQSGVTTVVDCGSLGVANIGVFPAYIMPRAKTRIICYLNIASFAHVIPRTIDMLNMDELNADAIAKCVEHNPGLISGIKLRLIGPLVTAQGEELVDRTKATAKEHGLPLMVHIGDLRAMERPHPERIAEVTKYLLTKLEPGDILTHVCTPNIGGIMDAAKEPLPEFLEARANGVVLDPALGTSNFGFEVARRQADLGLIPDTISSDMTGYGQKLHSLMECMAKFMAIDYSLHDVIRMTTVNPAKALGMEDSIGALAVGREADITVMDVVSGDYAFIDAQGLPFRGTVGITPVLTLRAGEMISPHWGTHPWGWLPASA